MAAIKLKWEVYSFTRLEVERTEGSAWDRGERTKRCQALQLKKVFAPINIFLPVFQYKLVRVGITSILIKTKYNLFDTSFNNEMVNTVCTGWYGMVRYLKLWLEPLDLWKNTLVSQPSLGDLRPSLFRHYSIKHGKESPPGSLNSYMWLEKKSCSNLPPSHSHLYSENFSPPKNYYISIECIIQEILIGL